VIDIADDAVIIRRSMHNQNRRGIPHE